eukprot:1161424-Pelagomonas_calceolata.AAC.14
MQATRAAGKEGIRELCRLKKGKEKLRQAKGHVHGRKVCKMKGGLLACPCKGVQRSHRRRCTSRDRCGKHEFGSWKALLEGTHACRAIHMCMVTSTVQQARADANVPVDRIRLSCPLHTPW